MNLWLPQLQQEEFARTNQVNYFHESLVRSLKVLLHSEYGVPKLLSCCSKVVGFFSISSTHHHSLLKNGLFYMIHLLKYTSDFWWWPNKVWTTVSSNHSNISSVPYKCSHTNDELINTQSHCVWSCLTASIQSTISFDFLPTILHEKWTSHANCTVHKWCFLTHSLLGQIWHFFVPEVFLSTVYT